MSLNGRFEMTDETDYDFRANQVVLGSGGIEWHHNGKKSLWVNVANNPLSMVTAGTDITVTPDGDPLRAIVVPYGLSFSLLWDFHFIKFTGATASLTCIIGRKQIPLVVQQIIQKASG